MCFPFFSNRDIAWISEASVSSSPKRGFTTLVESRVESRETKARVHVYEQNLSPFFTHVFSFFFSSFLFFWWSRLSSFVVMTVPRFFFQIPVYKKSKKTEKGRTQMLPQRKQGETEGEGQRKGGGHVFPFSLFSFPLSPFLFPPTPPFSFSFVGLCVGQVVIRVLVHLDCAPAFLEERVQGTSHQTKNEQAPQ